MYYPSMKELLYATPSGTRSDTKALRELKRMLSGDWVLEHRLFSDLVRLKTTPNITWLAFGALPTGVPPAGVLKEMALLLQKSRQPSMVVASGRIKGEQAKRTFVKEVLGTLDHPESVEFDWDGKIDSAEFDVLRAKLEARLKACEDIIPIGSILDVPNADLREDSGNLSAKRIADLYGVTLTELGEWIGRKKAALSKNPDAESVQPLLQPLNEIALIRKLLSDDEAFRKWLRTSQEDLEGQSPLELIRKGRADAIAGFAHAIVTGQPA